MRERNERGECERDSKPRSAGGQSKWGEENEGEGGDAKRRGNGRNSEPRNTGDGGE